jgi:hypothetical protein
MKQRSIHIKKEWYRYLLETFVVIASILVALSLENWNEQRKDRQEEIFILKSLQSEFIESSRRLDSILNYERVAISNCRELLLAHENGKTINFDLLTSLIYDGALAWHRFEPVTGAYDAIIGSGKLGLIRNNILRNKIAEYYADIEPGFADQDVSMDLIILLHQELGKDLLPLRGNNLFRQELTGIDPFSGSVQVNVESVMGNDKFFGLLYSKTVFEGYRLYYYMSWVSIIDEIKSIIDDEIRRLE